MGGTRLQLVEENVPYEDYVAAVGSGTLGYSRDRVVNLDGKVKSYIVQILGDGPEERGWRKVANRGGLDLYYREGE